MKGQSSLEYLAVLAAVLAFLAVWAGTAASTGNLVFSSLNSMDVRTSAKQLVSEIDSTCLMAPGSSVTSEFVFPTRTNIKYLNNSILFFWGNNTYASKTRCSVSLPTSMYGTVRVRMVRYKFGVVLYEINQT